MIQTNLRCSEGANASRPNIGFTSIAGRPELAEAEGEFGRQVALESVTKRLPAPEAGQQQAGRKRGSSE
jgi:hypothetical protein